MTFMGFAKGYLVEYLCKMFDVVCVCICCDEVSSHIVECLCVLSLAACSDGMKCAAFVFHFKFVCIGLKESALLFQTIGGECEL